MLLLVCTSLPAQEDVAIGETDLASEDEQWLEEMLQVLDESTEIATKSRLNADFVPGTVTVLHGRDLEALGMRNVWEALALIPGVMTLQRVPDAPTDIGLAIRGLATEFNYKVLLNGVTMARDISGLPSQTLTLPIEQVERIEFIRGPGSVLYGDFAYNGVLNILTRQKITGYLRGWTRMVQPCWGGNMPLRVRMAQPDSALIWRALRVIQWKLLRVLRPTTISSPVLLSSRIGACN
ncbi:MAG: Plug domain-containing protein [Candidatus Competibacteraceae bacterium]|nr:Plug domain-containing protein [Candidatus Competibacteraceae bacterium]